jgi:hypothetical protein
VVLSCVLGSRESSGPTWRAHRGWRDARCNRFWAVCCSRRIPDRSRALRESCCTTVNTGDAALTVMLSSGEMREQQNTQPGKPPRSAIRVSTKEGRLRARSVCTGAVLWGAITEQLRNKHGPTGSSLDDPTGGLFVVRLALKALLTRPGFPQRAVHARMLALSTMEKLEQVQCFMNLHLTRLRLR